MLCRFARAMRQSRSAHVPPLGLMAAANTGVGNGSTLVEPASLTLSDCRRWLELKHCGRRRTGEHRQQWNYDPISWPMVAMSTVEFGFRGHRPSVDLNSPVADAADQNAASVTSPAIVDTTPLNTTLVKSAALN